MTNQEWLKEFGRRVEEKMKEKDMNQKELADNAGVSTASLNKYIHGSVMPSAQAAFKIAVALGCGTDELFHM